MADKQGDFIWYELMTNDAVAAQAFYEPLIGWTFAGSGTSGVDYRVGSMDGTAIVGLLELSKAMMEGGAHPAWIGYLAVDDIHASIMALKDKGGQLFMGPNHLDGVGHMAIVIDPQGAAFYVMQAEGEGPATSFAKYTPQVGHCAWNELISADQVGANAFYTALFGWEKTDSMDMGEMGSYEIYRAGDYTLGAIMQKSAEMPASMWNYYFRVRQIAASSEYVKANGGQVVNGPTEIPGGDYVINAIDPQGAMFSLIGTKEG